MKVQVTVVPKSGVLDPQGKAIHASLSHLGIDGVEDVRVGKFMEITLKEIGPAEAHRRLDERVRTAAHGVGSAGPCDGRRSGAARGGRAALRPRPRTPAPARG